VKYRVLQDICYLRLCNLLSWPIFIHIMSIFKGMFTNNSKYHVSCSYIFFSGIEMVFTSIGKAFCAVKSILEHSWTKVCSVSLYNDSVKNTSCIADLRDDAKTTKINQAPALRQTCEESTCLVLFILLRWFELEHIYLSIESHRSEQLNPSATVFFFAEKFRSFFAETFRSFVSQLYQNLP